MLIWKMKMVIFKLSFRVFYGFVFYFLFLGLDMDLLNCFVVVFVDYV